MEVQIDQVNEYYQLAKNLALEYGPKLLLAVLTLILGLWLSNKFVKVVKKLMLKNNLDPSLIPFLTSLLNIGLKVLVLISVASMVGIETTSFVAILGAAGLAVGLALQGSLSNFAGGVLTLIFKPYKVGDLIEAQGHMGEVMEIHIFVTKLKTYNNELVIIPNGSLSNGDIINYSALGVRRVKISIGVSYKDDIKKAKNVIINTLKKNTKVLRDPEPFVGVNEFGDSSINLAVRAWCKAEDYWDVYYECMEACKYALDENGITIPFPQRDVHMIEAKK